MTEQHITEQILVDYLGKKGIHISWETELIEFEQKENNLYIELNNPKGKQQFAATYLIAADGAKSAIRKKLEIPFIGKSYALSLFVSDGRIETGMEKSIIFSFSDKAIAGMFPLKNNRWRIDGAMPILTGVQEGLDPDLVKNVFAESVKLDFSWADTEWFSVFQTHQRYASTIRMNNIFLIGDAAHIHSPIGAQGMNTGMQDADNLAWKLAYVLNR